MFNAIFVKYLQEHNISAYRLAKDTGISQGLISDYKNGNRKPTTENLIKIADYLDCSIDFLLGRKEENTSEQAKLTEKEQELLDVFRELNDIGQECIIHDARRTREDIKYQKYTDIPKEA